MCVCLYVYVFASISTEKLALQMLARNVQININAMFRCLHAMFR